MKDVIFTLSLVEKSSYELKVRERTQRRDRKREGYKKYIRGGVKDKC